MKLLVKQKKEIKMDLKKLLAKIDNIEGRATLTESKEDYEYYFGKDKKSDSSKERETGTGHTAKKTDKGTQYTKKDLPGQDTSKDSDTKQAEKRAKKKASEDLSDMIQKLTAIIEAKDKEVDEEKTDEGNAVTGGLADPDVKVGEKIPGTDVVKKKHLAAESEDKDADDDKDDDKERTDESIEDIYEAHVYHRVKAGNKSEYRHHKTFKDEEAAQDYAKDWNKKHGDEKKTAVVKMQKVGENIARNPHESLEECYDSAMGQQQESGMNINASTDTRTGNKSLTVTAQGESAEQLAQLLRLSGLGGGQAQGPEQVDVQVGEEYANEPQVTVQGLEPQLQQGNDMHRQKASYPKVAGGDNPMAMREARELAEIEQRLNEELAAFKVMAEGDIDEGVADNLKKAAAAGILGLGLAAGGTQAVKDYNTSQDQRQTQQQAPTVKIGSKNYKVFSQDLASKGEYFARKVGSALKDKIIVTDGSGNQFYLGVSSNNGHNYRLLPTSQTNVNSPTATVGNKQMSVISPTDYEKGFGKQAVLDKILVKDNSGNSYYLQVTSNTGHNMWLVPVKNVKEGVAEGKGKKPDFLDMDKDGDKKEPMKKAIADKSKKK